MGSDDLAIRVLIEIRDQISELRHDFVERLDGHERQLALLTGETAGVRGEIVALHDVLKDVAHVIKGRRKLEARLDRCEREIDALKRKVG